MWSCQQSDDAASDCRLHFLVGFLPISLRHIAAPLNCPIAEALIPWSRWLRASAFALRGVAYTL